MTNDDKPDVHKPNVRVVGIGASAGGIEALSRFFDAMPVDSGCAFVVVLHLDPNRESELAHILSVHTTMPVTQVEDGMRIAANNVYVIAPDSDLRVRNGLLHLSKPTVPRGHGHPVDVLFQSLSVDQHQGAIAVVLSGTGSNGTEGLKEIRAEGGMSIVQTPDTAKFDGMPRSAIMADMADHVLAPEDMPATILAYIHHGYVSGFNPPQTASAKKEATLDQVLDLLRAYGGHDFRGYKHSTLKRRVHRRLGLRNIETLGEYLIELRGNPEEVSALALDLMISVTGFFRDAEAWSVLTELVIVPMLAERANDSPIRIWVPACSTGEEAYSIAMLITEQAELLGKRFDLKVFATDAQEGNLRHARDGIYPDAALAEFPAARRTRFFEKLEGNWQVNKGLRGLVVFAPQNLLRDPPFSRLDLISCRNVLIYLEPEAQQKIISICHFALSPGAHLFLGNAETIGRHEELFDAVSKKWRIYRRVGATPHSKIDYPLQLGLTEPRVLKPSTPFTEASNSVAELARRALLDQFAPAAVLIDGKARVLYFHGATGDFLQQPTGEPTRDLLTMARDGLIVKLRLAIREAIAENRGITATARMRQSDDNKSVAITVTPMPGQGDNNLLLVSFVPALSVTEHAQPAARSPTEDVGLGERVLQEELTTIRAELLTTVEHLETANEELKASNEEATSMNEELQSTNEELETSKEELQSFNEELNTVNSQLQHKIGELESATNDLNNLLIGSETATLFLDEKMCIKWSSPATRELFDLVSSDAGRPIAHFAQKFSDNNLLRDAELVMKNLATIEAEVPTDTGRWYLRRMLPYRTQDNRIAGVVVTFIDITARRQEEEALRRSEARLQELIEALPGAVYITDTDGRITFFNPAVAELWGRTPEVGLSDSARLSWPDGTAIPTDANPMIRSVRDKRSLRGIEVAVDRPDGVLTPILAYTTLLHGDSGEVRGAVNMLVDVTESRRGEAAERRLASIVASSDDAIISKDLDGTVNSWNKAAESLFGYLAEEIIGKSIMLLVPEGRQSEETDIIDRIRRGEHIDHYDTVRQAKDGRAIWTSLTVSPLRDAQGTIIGASTIARDMTERRHADEHRKTLIDELNHRVKNTLAVVQAIAAQTLGDGATMKEARAAFGSRLINLGNAHDVLTRENWAGANLIDLVTDTVRPHAGGENRFAIEGEHVRLDPGAALSIAMAVHELCTNAAKYGALSTKEGRIGIIWALEHERLKLTWTESGGPPVTPPKSKGFGSRLIEQALARELRGKVSMTYEPSGVICTIDAPMPSSQTPSMAT
ncbi:MAG: hypothetical protein JWL66_1574 [Sphingomonadales bacterium]|nr:hypothetical protein [Sphingomonadales bacterium]